MKVFTHFGRNYPYDPLRNLDFNFSSNPAVNFFYGGGVHRKIDVPEYERDGKIDFESGLPWNLASSAEQEINVLLTCEYPQEWLFESNDGLIHMREREFDRILTIEPTLVENRNRQLGMEKYQYVFLPTSAKRVPTNFHKTNDVFFSGHLLGDRYPLHSQIIQPILEKYQNNSRVVSGEGASGGSGISYDEKLQANAQSKISIVYNHQIVFESTMDRATQISDTISLGEDTTGNHSHGQLKYRTFEAFLSKTVVLCYEDSHNLIADWATPGEHFLYYSSAEELDSKIDHVLNHYDDYQDMIESSHKHALENFTTEAFFNKFLKDLKWE